MAKNDYHVVVYRVLTYLYDCLKRGDDPDPGKLASIARLAEVGDRYWHYILRSLMDYGFVKGATRVDIDGTYERVLGLERAEITPVGIEYLTENSFMAKVGKFLKDTKDMVPFA